MAGKIRHLTNRDGRYFARLVVPQDLRKIIGKTELRTPLGADRTAALKRLPSAVGALQDQIAAAEHRLHQDAGRPTPHRYPMTQAQIVREHYLKRLEWDTRQRNDPRYAAIEIDDILVFELREGAAGRLSDQKLNELVGGPIDYFRARGNTVAEPGTDAWRELARNLCIADLEALERMYERDEGDFSGSASTPLIRDASPVEEPVKRVGLDQLTNDYVSVRQKAGYMANGGKELRTAVEKLKKHLRHANAAEITKKDLQGWRDQMLSELTPKTVSDRLSSIRALLNWAVENDHLPENPAAEVRQRMSKAVQGRERGFTEEEATRILRASRTYSAKQDSSGTTREGKTMVSVKQWVPLLCAFTGARVSEITQLRKEDVQEDAGVWIIRITPDAGSVKTGHYRDVPLHQQIIDEGFLRFVANNPPGPLFHNAADAIN